MWHFDGAIWLVSCERSKSMVGRVSTVCTTTRFISSELRLSGLIPFWSADLNEILDTGNWLFLAISVLGIGLFGNWQWGNYLIYFFLTHFTTIKIGKRLLTSTVPVNNFLETGNVPVNNSLLIGTLSNVFRCWLAMPLGAGDLRWVLVWRTIEKKSKV